MNERDGAIFKMTVYAEARGEGPEGIRAVAHATWNRFQARKWFSRKTLAAACLLKWQFSSWNTEDPNRLAAAEVDDGDDLYALCSRACDLVASGADPDPTDGATHYYSTTMPKPPDWAATGVFTRQIGRHRFYAGVK